MIFLKQIKHLHHIFILNKFMLVKYILLKQILQLFFVLSRNIYIYRNIQFYLLYYSDERFLNTHSISSDRIIKLFVRVKERIIPNNCSYKITQAFIEIILTKDNPNSTKWGRLESSEYSESRPLTQQTSPSTPPSSPISSTATNINSTMINSNKGKIEYLSRIFNRSSSIVFHDSVRLSYFMINRISRLSNNEWKINFRSRRVFFVMAQIYEKQQRIQKRVLIGHNRVQRRFIEMNENLLRCTQFIRVYLKASPF